MEPENLDIVIELLASMRTKLDRIAAMIAAAKHGEELEMALSQQELDVVAKLGNDIDAVAAAADQHAAALQASIDSLAKQVKDITTVGQNDKATIDQLNATVADLQSAAASHASDVVQSLSGLDQHVQTLMANESASAPAAATEPTQPDGSNVSNDTQVSTATSPADAGPAPAPAAQAPDPTLSSDTSTSAATDTGSASGSDAGTASPDLPDPNAISSNPSSASTADSSSGASPSDASGSTADNVATPDPTTVAPSDAAAEGDGNVAGTPATVDPASAGQL